MALESSLCVEAATILTNVWPLSTLVDVLAIVFEAKLAISRGTNTGECSNEILATELAVVCFRPAFINVSTVATVRSKLVSIRTDASIRPGCVVASESALVANFTALVDILAGSKRSWSVASSARAQESTVSVGARAVTTQTEILVALIPIYALSP